VRRRRATSRNPAKTQQTIKVKRRATSKAAPNRHLSPSALSKDTEVARLTRERDEARKHLAEALEQQAATSEVLRVISSAPSELESVFQTILESATRICEAKFGALFPFDRNKFYRAASVGTPPALVEFQKQRGPFEPSAVKGLERVLLTKEVIHTADEGAAPNLSAAGKYGGARATVRVPMLKDDKVVGAIASLVMDQPSRSGCPGLWKLPAGKRCLPIRSSQERRRRNTR
jgi:two-component system NtrC family sensor kinase